MQMPSSLAATYHPTHEYTTLYLPSQIPRLHTQWKQVRPSWSVWRRLPRCFDCPSARNALVREWLSFRC
jgi:hypothetical protein